jgi:NAD(P)-dependent dehydrogenase (short-subunit alcohol dehydrogenase family)
MNKQPWALILGASSGFGAAAALELARGGMNVFGFHLDRRETLPQADEVQRQIRECGREALFFNGNAADEARRKDAVDAMRERMGGGAGTVRVLLHSLAFGAVKPLTGEGAAGKKQLELTADVMGHSLVVWVQDLLAAGLLERGARIFAMTSGGSRRAIPSYGPVGAAKAVLEAHVRQLALELAPHGITANAIQAGVTDTPALRAIPGHERLAEFARTRNPHGRLTRPEDVARAIALLADERSYWITGNTIRVDGGEDTVG